MRDPVWTPRGSLWEYDSIKIQVEVSNQNFDKTPIRLSDLEHDEVLKGLSLEWNAFKDAMNKEKQIKTAQAIKN